jgi:hypothetical protein
MVNPNPEIRDQAPRHVRRSVKASEARDQYALTALGHSPHAADVSHEASLNTSSRLLTNLSSYTIYISTYTTTMPQSVLSAFTTAPSTSELYAPSEV